MTGPSAITATDIAAELHADDLLVFEVDDGRARLLGGSGRGDGWAGVVEVAIADEPLLSELAGRRVARMDADEPQHVLGPYWAASAAAVSVGDHVVVVGSSERIRASSAELIRRATEAVAVVGDIPASKLLADELELAQAVQQLSEHTPHTLAGAATHVAAVAADALSCEIGAVLLRIDGQTHVNGAGPAWDSVADDATVISALHALADRAARGPIVEQDLAAVSTGGLRIVSCYALGIGRHAPLGALIVGHTDARPRGFTLLCQRVGRAIADASEPTLLQAIAHEDLAAQRDRFAREARIDPLTGLGNRTTWDATLATEQARWERHARPLVLLSMDLDHLKATNDAFGHAVGDEILVGAADILRSTLRGGDVIVRLGGDEFAALLPETDATGVAALRARIDAACAAWRGSEPGVRLSLSMGWAVPEWSESLVSAFSRADRAMYEAKRSAAQPAS
jgi:diguanylate cyclase (GGDEF)-like protein